ncbi:hypothetical protein CDAR_220361 [Caerostris darwini]|uniref:Uncharacterized protein n=1 Tax=Caerostris darwini TaxID=1538125 RepID=A0AAV4UFJ3_9ARAC|nr:hypothetical protein CDAR_220361 [Caerostris darwini]
MLHKNEPLKRETKMIIQNECPSPESFKKPNIFGNKLDHVRSSLARKTSRDGGVLISFGIGVETGLSNNLGRMLVFVVRTVAGIEEDICLIE